MRVEIKRLHQRLGTTIVFVTHDQVEAMTLADRIVVMKEGRILQVGPPMEVYERPADVFTARFIGSPTMNLLPGRLTAGSGGPVAALQVGAPVGWHGRPMLPRAAKSSSACGRRTSASSTRAPRPPMWRSRAA
jgi:multiple sugar transport system ATP-binding protein